MTKQIININDLSEKLLKGNKQALSRAITLVESSSGNHIEKAQAILNKIINKTGKSIRIGITGSPGVGKSTFINKFGTMLCNDGHKVAVLAIDPSSSISKGSILGDKTRMSDLSSHSNSFIRPSPAGGILGGVARKTRESILLCEAAGYDLIFVETVGIGQSETTVRSMSDLMLLMLFPGGGDELQGIKKGIIELADLVLINKSDGDSENSAKITRNDFEMALHYINSPTTGWTPLVLNISSETGFGLNDLWKVILEFENHTKKTGIFSQRRNDQLQNWFDSEFQNEILRKINYNEKFSNKIEFMRKKISDGESSVYSSVREIIEMVFNK